MDGIVKTLTRFVKFSKRHRIDRGIVNALPYGNVIDLILNGGSVDDAIENLRRENAEKQKEMLDLLEKIIRENKPQPDDILVIGSGNVENILTATNDIVVAEKHTVERSVSHGGSGTNYALRLLAAGHDAYPILSIGDDQYGQEIISRIVQQAKMDGASLGVLDFLNVDKYLSTEMSTPSTTIVVSPNERKMYSEKPSGLASFKKYMEKQIDRFQKIIEGYPSVVMIGHIFADSGEYENIDKGECTISLLTRYKSRSTICTNFGYSQLKHGSKFWEQHLPCIDIFQLNIMEAKLFFSDDDTVLNLVDMMNWFTDRNINAVITLDKFGAVATHSDISKCAIIGWPIIDRNEVVDATGAGDAFASAILSIISSAPRNRQNKLVKIDEELFRKAIKEGRIWSAEACMHFGASTMLPNKSDIIEFSNANKASLPLACNPISGCEDILKLIDIAFSEQVNVTKKNQKNVTASKGSLTAS